jgi:hypothetical protein
VEERFGGPVWHASGSHRSGSEREARRVARSSLVGVGDEAFGEWEYAGEKPGVFHVLRRLTADERSEFGVPEPYDIRGTTEERARIDAVYAEAPHLRVLIPWS